MQQLIIPENPKIVNIEDNSTHTGLYGIDRLFLTFENGLKLSVIRGFGTFGSEQGFFEIAPFDREGEMNGNILGFNGDHVKGYLTKEDVLKYIDIISGL